MSLLHQRIKAELLAARKASKKTEAAILSVLLGEVQHLQASPGQKGEVTDSQVVRLARKLLESNGKCLESLQPGQDMFNRLQLENLVLEGLLPQMWTKNQILEYLRASSKRNVLLEQRTHGQATGIAIKLLNSQHLPVDGGDVAAAVQELRETT